MRVELLGPLRVLDDSGAEVAVPAGRQRALLARLALEPGRAVSSDALVDALWPAAAPVNAAGALHTQLSRLRRRLGDRVATEANGYRLTGVAVDLSEFEQLAAQTEVASREDAPAVVRDRAEAALALWRGPSELERHDFAEAVLVRLAARREAVAALRADARLRLEGAEAVLAEFAAGHAADPMNEPLAARYMRALAAAGRQAEALAVYDRVRTALADELGVDPSAQLQEARLDVLRGVEPAPAPANARRLPQPLTACIGRESELEALPALLAADRLVTLTGPGGTGKTRLAVETARLLEARGTTARLVELAPVTDAARLPEVVLDALRLTESPTSRRIGDPLDRLVEALRAADMLLVVDNCEHVIAATADLIAFLLPRAPGVTVLATSREPLGITGEHVFALAPLALPGPDAEPGPAVRLFAERAARADREFTMDASGASLVAEICTALDGLPLAIELAAARLRTMNLADLAARLHDRFGLLTRGDRTAAPRQRNLRAVVDWSWDLLDDAERLALARFSVFNGGADLDAACEVCETDVDIIASLVDKSLVQRLPNGRYRLLETIRAYAAGRLAELGETAARRVAHARCFARRAERAERHLMRAEQVAWLDRLALDHGNYTAAIRRMIAAGNTELAYRTLAPLSWYWWMRGHRREGQELARQVRAMPIDGGITPLQRARLALAGNWGMWSGSLDPSVVGAEYEAAQALIEEHDLYEAEPVLRMVPVIRALLAGDGDTLRAIAAGLDPDRDAWVRGMTLLFLSDVSVKAGDLDRAAAEIAESHAIFERLGERFGLVMSLQSLAAGRMAVKDYLGARGLLTRALQAESEFGADLADSVIVEHLWRLDAEYGPDPAALLEELREAAGRARRIGNIENVVGAATAASICLRRLGKLTEARDLLLDAESELPRYLSFSESSLHLFRQAAAVAREIGDPDLEARAAARLAQSAWPFSA
ncbi:winged helix-turn-helix domain-containing protein [Glycomyces sp. TRM65418]|uniref:BTAD domain-containing putative transcriptional regulator n=1 Tax=Glycomyces sp. TRM65418 TaxID=2867006 RepID=UPI001CE714AE|nr:BTAD domain-containing putative transcriptional regulator [Glycomyces sp. TRM65418]MCC3764252.1 winged helix-turn-helix domain-containing protein [Glycomyces sp. TRM65418]QZD53936.1 winged helix-turn-helix domain-containing protein [Glycomyces sp. TRM65418]